MDEITELDRIRLEDDLSYSELAAAISQVVGKRVDASVVHRALRLQEHTRDRTRYKFRMFIEAHAEAKRRLRRRA